MVHRGWPKPWEEHRLGSGNWSHSGANHGALQTLVVLWVAATARDGNSRFMSLLIKTTSGAQCDGRCVGLLCEMVLTPITSGSRPTWLSLHQVAARNPTRQEFQENKKTRHHQIAGLLSDVSELPSIFSVAIAGKSIKRGEIAFYWGDRASWGPGLCFPLLLLLWALLMLCW